MTKHRLLESMLSYSLLASVIGFGLGVLAVFFFASQIFEHQNRPTNGSGQATVTTDSRRPEAAPRAADQQIGQVPQSPADQTPGVRPEPAGLSSSAAPAPTPVQISRWPWVILGVLAGLGVFSLAFLAWLQLKLMLGSQPSFLKHATKLSVTEEEPLAPEPRIGAQSNGRPADELLDRLAGTLEQLEGRLRRLEQIPARAEYANGRAETQQPGPEKTQPREERSSAQDENEAAKLRLGRALRTRRLLANGEALLKAENANRALECFEEALTLEPNSAEAHVKRGNALERLGRLEDALAAYDRAIAADGTATIAYLFKGGVCNRLDRHEEALRCYQRALNVKPEPASH